jgi:hypothetical protein
MYDGGRTYFGIDKKFFRGFCVEFANKKGRAMKSGLLTQTTDSRQM